MAYKYREELVGKRFLSLSGPGKLKLSKIGDWEWRAGIIRAASFRDPKQLELTVLVEFDDVDWKRREWIRVYEENIFQVFAVENTLVWTNRKNHQGSKSIQWPAINYKILVDKVGLKGHRHHPVEFLVDKTLTYVDYAELKPHQESEEFHSQAAILNYPEVAKTVRQWSEYQDGQRILLTTPSVLVGYRVEVYRSEGTTQWYTAVIVSYNENTRELTLTDDTVLEEHNEDPSLVQMRLIGDGVVESILRGENVGITPRRRACTLQHQHLGHYTRTRSQTPSHVTCPRILPAVHPRKTRVRTGHEFGTAGGGGPTTRQSPSADSDREKERLYVRDKKAIPSYDAEGESSSSSSTCSEELLKNRGHRRKKREKRRTGAVKPKSDGASSRSSSDSENGDERSGTARRRTERHRGKREDPPTNLKSRRLRTAPDFASAAAAEDDSSSKDRDKQFPSKNDERPANNDFEPERTGSRSSPPPPLRGYVPPVNSAVAGLRNACVRRCSVVLDAVEHHPSLGSVGKPRVPRVIADAVRHSRPAVVLSELPSPSKAGPSPDPESGEVEPANDGACPPSEASVDVIASADPRPSSSSSPPESPRRERTELESAEPRPQRPSADALVVRDRTPSETEPRPLVGCPETGADIPSCSTSSVIGGGEATVPLTEEECPRAGSPSLGHSAESSADPRPSPDRSDASLPPATSSVDASEESCRECVASGVSSSSQQQQTTASGVKARSPVVTTPTLTTTTTTTSCGGSLVLDKNEPVKIWRDPKLVRTDKSVRHIRSVQHSTMAHPPGTAHGSYTPGGSTAPHPSAMGQHGRTSAVPSLTLPAHYAPPHLSSAPHPAVPHVSASSGSAAAYLEQQAALRLSANSAAALGVAPSASSQPSYPSHHTVVAQHLLPPQYQAMHGADLMWLQKYPPAPSPTAAWVLKYQEDQERAILMERERQARMERDMRERMAQADHLEQEQLEKERKERAERERREKEKLEKEKLERERLQKERLEQERAKKERAAAAEKQRLEQERAQRDVHQHFEESLRMMTGHPWSARVGMPSRSIPSGGSPGTDASATSSHVSEVGGRVSGRGAVVATTSAVRGVTTVVEAGHGHQRQAHHLPPSHHHHHHHHHQQQQQQQQQQHHPHHHHHHHPTAVQHGKEPMEMDLKDVRVLGNTGFVQGVLTPEEQQQQQQRRAREEEKWLAIQRHHEAAVTLASVKPAGLRHPEVQHRSSAVPPHGYATTETSHVTSSRHKSDYPMNVANPQSQNFAGTKSGASGSGAPKSEPSHNYNLYGYQPFQHSYIIQDRNSVVGNHTGGPPVTNAVDAPKGLDPGKVLVTGTITQTVAPSHPRRSGHGTPPSGVPYPEHDRRFHPPHSSVIVSSESARHDASKSVVTSAILQKQQLPPPPRMGNGPSQERTSPAYPSMGAGSTAFRPYEYGHSQNVAAVGEGHPMRAVTLPPPHHSHHQHHHQHHQQQQHHHQQQHQQQQQHHHQHHHHHQQHHPSHPPEPQNLHKGNLGPSDPYSSRPPPRTSPSSSSPSIVASTSAGGYGGHSSPLPAATAAAPHPQAKTAPAYSSSNLIQQGLVPNPMYNQAASGATSRGGSAQPAASCPSPCPSSSSTSSAQSYKSVSKTATPPGGGGLPLPTRSSPSVPYGKASIVAGTPACRMSATVPPPQPQASLSMTPFSRQTPPPAHHNGSRGLPDHSRPPSAHSRPSSGITPPSRTATPGQTSHSPMDCGVTRRSITPSASPHLQMHPSGYSSPLPPIGSPHVPSPLPLTSAYSLATSRSSSSSCSSAEAVRPHVSSPPQTQPLDLQAPDRHRDSGSPVSAKRKPFKESQARKRQKPMMIGVANEGLAAAVASAHQIMSGHGGDGPLPARVGAPSPLVAGAATTITTVVNSVALDTLSIRVTAAAASSSTTTTTTATTSQPTSCSTSAAPIGVVQSAPSVPQTESSPVPPPPPPPPPVTVAVNTTSSTASQDGFLNSFRSFVHSTQQQSQLYQDYPAYQYGKHKGKHKVGRTTPSSGNSSDGAGGSRTTVPTASSTVVAPTTTNVVPTPPPPSSSASLTMTGPAASVPRPTRVTSSSPGQSSSVNGPVPEPEKAASPALSTCSSTSSNPVTKLKKEWLIRHSNEDGKSCAKSETLEATGVAANVAAATVASSVPSSSPATVTLLVQPSDKDGNDAASDRNSTASLVATSINGHTAVKLESGPTESATSEDSEADSVSTNSTTVVSAPKSSKKRKTRSKRKSSGKDVKKHKSAHENRSEKSSYPQDEEIRDLEEEVPAVKIEACPPRKRGRKPKSKSARAEAVRKSKSSKLSSVKSGRLSLARLKRTGESFLQKGPCYEVAHKLSKCRECRMTQNQRSKKLPNIFCRFYEFRRLRYSKNGFLTIAGFSEPQDANEEDLRLWLPLVDDPPVDLEVDTSEFIVTHVGDQFCDLVEQEREAQAMHMSEDKTIAWKRVVQGVREMCDVCETTLFNIHWACSKCGFVVCIDCYKARRNGTVKEEESPGKDRDEYSWLLCNNRQPHEQEKLMLTQIIAGNALWDMGKYVHDIRKKWGIASYCACTRIQNDPGNKSPVVNGFCKQLMSAVSKCFVPDSHNESSNGGSESIKSSKKLAKAHNSINGTLEYIKQEGGVAGYNPDGASPLSWLADVALNSSSKLADGGGNGEASVKEKGKDRGGSDSRRRSVPSDGSDTEDSKSVENYSTLRELLIRPTSKNSSGNKNNNGTTGSHKKKMSRLDEVISHVIQQSANNNVERLEKPVKEEMKLLHYMKRYPHPRNGREPLPIRIFTLEESRLLFPGTPHTWLCSGRLLRLLDPYHKGNLKLFQELWKRGQPVLVSEVNKRLDINLWHPEAFARDFGDIKNDLVNCNNGNIVPNQPMRKFWEGFETFAKRMKDENGEYMLLKLKDWPPGDDFSEMLPSRFDDLMKALPLPEYTHRNGLLNMAGRLPECFVRPDLGPKMYNAYGSAQYPDKGTTNLHLDISDAVNVMVYVGIPKDGNDEQHIQEALKAIEEGGCDTLTQRRVREKGQKPGALWHIYNARDADKIRDLLNKVAIEKGEKLEPHHDPIHDQSWYLDGPLRERLYKEYGVEGYAIAQCLGDAVFIPAGAPHQVRNLHSCIKVAEDFVSPENISHCFTLTQEFRDLSDTHTNHEDKLQVKNIIYHAVRDALALLMGNDPPTYYKNKKNQDSEPKK